MSWVTLTTAPDQAIAEAWLHLLLDGGFAARLDARDVQSFLGVTARPCRLLVREEDLEAARHLLPEEIGRE